MLSLMYMRKYLIPFLLIILVGCATYSNKLENKIKLEGNPTTGYTWVKTIEKEGIVNLEERILPLEPNIVGGPSIFEYTLMPISVGHTYIKFEYMRPWEGVAIKSRHFSVTVYEDSLEVVEVGLD